MRAGNVLPRPPGYDGPKSFYEFLVTVKKQGNHGEAFAYKTVNADALGWVIARYASFPLAANANIDPTSLPAYHSLAKHLIAHPR